MLVTFTHAKAVWLLALATLLAGLMLVVLEVSWQRAEGTGQSITSIFSRSGERATPGSSAKERHAYRAQLGR